MAARSQREGLNEVPAEALPADPLAVAAALRDWERRLTRSAVAAARARLRQEAPEIPTALGARSFAWQQRWPDTWERPGLHRAERDRMWIDDVWTDDPPAPSPLSTT